MACVAWLCLNMTGLYAQTAPFTMTTNVGNVSCVNNGAIYAHPTGGTPPYGITLLSGPTFAGLRFPFQLALGKTNFQSLPPGIYVVKGEDVFGNSVIDTVKIAGSYTYPVVNISLSSNCILASGQQGTPPYQYAVSTTGVPGTFTPYQGDSQLCVDCNRSYFVRVIDSCGNFYTTPAVFVPCPTSGVPILGQDVFNISCTPGSNDTVTIVDTSGITPASYTYYLNRDPIHLSNHTGSFIVPSSCTPFGITIKDSVGKIVAIDTLNCSTFIADMGCADCTHGSAFIGIKGGIPPYIVKAYINDSTLVDSNSTGVFNSLPLHPAHGYRFTVTDQCGKQVFDFHRNCLKVRMGPTCPFSGKLFLAFLDTVPDADRYDTSAYGPLTFTCVSCTPQQVKVLNFKHGDSADATAPNSVPIFTGLKLGDLVVVKIQDTCGAEEMDTVFLKKAKSSLQVTTTNCSLHVESQVFGYIDTLEPYQQLYPKFYLADSATKQNIDSNQTGTFNHLKAKSYFIYTTPPTCLNSDTSYFRFKPVRDTIYPTCTTVFLDSSCRWNSRNVLFPNLTGSFRDSIFSFSTGKGYSSRVPNHPDSVVFQNVPAGYYSVKVYDTFCRSDVRIDTATIPSYKLLVQTNSNCFGAHDVVLGGTPNPNLCSITSFIYKIYSHDTLYKESTSGSFYAIGYQQLFAKLFINQPSLFGLYPNPYDSICPVDSAKIPLFGNTFPKIILPRLSFFVCGAYDSIDVPFLIQGGNPPFIVQIQGYDTLKINSHKGSYNHIKPGFYTLVVSDNCGISTSIQLSVLDSCFKCGGIAKYKLNAAELCLGDTFIATNQSSDAQLYVWSVDGRGISTDTNFRFVPPHAGYYQIGLKLFEVFCKDSIQQTIEVDTPSPISLIPDTAFCNSFAIQLNSGNPYSQWSTGVQRSAILVTRPGIYWASYHNVCGIFSDTVLITQHLSPTLTLPHDTSFCAGDSVQISVHSVPPATYVWSSGSTDSLLWVSRTGIYYLTASEGPCPGYDSVQVGQYHDPTHLFDSTPQPCIGDVTELHAQYGKHPVWGDSTTDSVYIVTQSGVYTLTVQGRCAVVKDSVSIIYRDCHCNLFVPTGFSPNNDGVDDKFRTIPSCNLESFEIKIFNRWGEMVFRSTDPTIAWDGTYLNQPQPMSVFIYTVHWSDSINHVDHFWRGNVTLVR